MSWYDSDGNAWLYGGTGSLASSTFVSSELWKYTSSGWAWISGTQGATENASYGPRGAASVSAQPGSRLRAAAWYGNGFLWLFGGEVMVSGVASHPNDLWRYNGATWTWVGGSDEDNLAGAYRDTGVGRPGGRDPAAAWTGSDGRFWLFGGEAGGNLRNDLWYYQP